MNDFEKFATRHLGINSMVLDDVIKAQNTYLNPYILEERRLNVTQMDVFSRLMMDRVIFLGYGDSLHSLDNHIYNAPENEMIPSQINRTATYGLETHPAFHNGHDYTYGNLYADMKALILECRPDVIYCVDYDPHVDHKACSMLFEKVMGDILRSEPDYSG